MQSLRRGSSDKDGILKLRMPADLANQDVDVVVVLQSRSKPELVADTRSLRGWPPGFFENIAGSIPDFPVIDAESDFEQRAPLT
ncbi:MAG: hypothetical protein U1F68_02115 [Gammaproteobacteria bacterium]